MDTLKVNDHHQSIINGYSQHHRYQRQQYLKTVDLCFKDVIDSKLLEDTYTRDEVEEKFKNIQNTIIDDLEAELINILQTNVLMLYQFFQQAEKWHLKLSLDLSEMQNKELLEEVKNLENFPLKLDRPKLTPLLLNVDKTPDTLRLEIMNLQNEKEKLSEDLKNLQEKLLNTKEEQENLMIQCEEKDSLIANLKEAVERSVQDKNLFLLEQKNSDSEKILEDYDKVLAEQIGKELEEMKKKVDAAEAQLSLAEMELNKKFNHTAAYNNMKKIIAKKNEQIKDLRNQLSKYETLSSTDIPEEKENE